MQAETSTNPRKGWVLRGALLGVASLVAGAVAVSAAASGGSSDVGDAELAAGGGTPSRTLVYAGVGANGCNAAGSVDFKDRGDVFTVHDFCEDGYGLLAIVCPDQCFDPPIVSHVENKNGFDGEAVSKPVNVKEGLTYEVTLIVQDGEREITRNEVEITE